MAGEIASATMLVRVLSRHKHGRIAHEIEPQPVVTRWEHDKVVGTRRVPFLLSGGRHTACAYY